MTISHKTSQTVKFSHKQLEYSIQVIHVDLYRSSDKVAKKRYTKIITKRKHPIIATLIKKSPLYSKTPNYEICKLPISLYDDKVIYSVNHSNKEPFQLSTVLIT